jgi:AraC-like DNA-binding protein
MNYTSNKEIDNEEDLIYVDYKDGAWHNQEEFTFKKARLIYAEGGVLHVFTAGNHWYLPGRCYMWIPPNTPHSIISSSSVIEFFSFYFKIDNQEEDFFKHTSIYLVNDLLREMIFYTKDWKGAISIDDERRFYFMKAIKSILPNISSKIASFPVQHPFPKDKRLHEIAIYLNKNLHESLTLEEVAQKFGYSTRSLSRLFNEHLGMSYVKFLRAIRIAKSLEMIAENKSSVYEIALQVGYSSLSAFSNIFYRVLGMRPTEFIAKSNK